MHSLTHYNNAFCGNLEVTCDRRLWALLEKFVTVDVTTNYFKNANINGDMNGNVLC
jgi:hypothetical protein